MLQSLLPESVLVVTALILLGLAVSKRDHAVGAQRIAAAGTLVALALLVLRGGGAEPGGTDLILADPLAHLARGVLLVLGFLALLLPIAPQET